MGVLVTGANPKEETRLQRRGNRIPGSVAPGAPVRGDVWYDTGTGILKVWTGSSWINIGGSETVSPPARIGASPAGAHGSSYMSIDHTGRAYTTANHYVLLADTTNSFLNAPTGGNVFIRIENSTRMQVSAGGIITYGAGAAELTVSDTATFRSNYGFTMPQFANLYLRGYGDTNHRIITPAVAPAFGTNFNVDGPCYVGYNQWVLATGNNGHWQMAVGVNYIQVFGGLGVSNGSNNDINIDPESITTVSTGSGISMRQRTRGSNDSARRCVMYADADRMKFWQEGQGDLLNMWFGSNYWLSMGLPGGSDADTIVRIAGSNQLLKFTSTIKAKKDVESLDLSENNPVWDMKPVTFKWNHRPQEELDRLDRLRPGGKSVGFIAEDMHEIAPTCVTFDANDEPDGLNETGILAYIVAGLQHVNQRLELLEKEKG